MNGGVLPWLMSQLMVFSCLISIVLSVSVAPGGLGAALPLGSQQQGRALTSLQAAGALECLGLGVMREEMEGWTSTH